VLSGAIARVEGDPGPGDTVQVVDHEGGLRGRGAWSPASQISVRMWTFEPDEEVSAALLRRRLAAAVAARRGLVGDGPSSACRLVYSESDGLPGLIVDRYADTIVGQLLSAGAERWRREIVAALVECFPAAAVWERSDVELRRKEGLEPRAGPLAGAAPPELVEIDEDGLRFAVDVRGGQKTGFYLDQRDSRAAVSAHAAGRRALNAFAYTGGFAIAALRNGATSVTNVESSRAALDLLDRNVALNGIEPARVENLRGDAFRLLRELDAAGRRFDLVVLDPPRFADSRDQVARAARGYKDVNRLAFRLLDPGGLLYTFSCSGHLHPDLFQKIVADAALDAPREARIVGRLAQPADHPVALGFPESAYLKGLVCRVS